MKLKNAFSMNFDFMIIVIFEFRWYSAESFRIMKKIAFLLWKLNFIAQWKLQIQNQGLFASHLDIFCEAPQYPPCIWWPSWKLAAFLLLSSWSLLRLPSSFRGVGSSQIPLWNKDNNHGLVNFVLFGYNNLNVLKRSARD